MARKARRTPVARKAVVQEAVVQRAVPGRSAAHVRVLDIPAGFGEQAAPKAASAFRFKPGDRILTRQDIPRGHCRTPYYLRGRPGVIERCLGHFRNPETLAYGKPGLPKAGLYTVRYELPKLWPGYTGTRADTLVADLFEFWLDPA